METGQPVGSASRLAIARIWTWRSLLTVLAIWLITAGARAAVGAAADEPADRVEVEIQPEGPAVISNGLLRIETETGKQHPGDTVLRDLRRGTDIALPGDQLRLSWPEETRFGRRKCSCSK